MCPPWNNWNALVVTGKSEDLVQPATVAFPAASTAMPLPNSLSEPPRYVEYTRDEASGASLATNTSAGSSCVSPWNTWTALVMGKPGFNTCTPSKTVEMVWYSTLVAGGFVV